MKAKITTETANRLDVSIIIPSNHCHQDLVELTHELCKQKALPSAIIIIDSSSERGQCPSEIKKNCRERGITLIYKSTQDTFPGAARNIGIDCSNSNLIAFLDVKTIPKQTWLENAKKLLNEKKTMGVWGLTKFEAQGTFEKLARDGFFGRNPRRTLPGTILRKETLDKVGKFVEWTRAGEDTDIIQRIEMFRMNFTTPSEETTTYTGLTKQSPLILTKKWLRNYDAARRLPHLKSQKLMIWLLFWPTTVLIALNWNNLIAGWKTDSLLYIPNVTKIAAFSPAVIYLTMRGLIIPNRNGVPLTALLPVRWLAIAITCLLGDTAKTIALIKPQRFKKTG